MKAYWRVVFCAAIYILAGLGMSDLQAQERAVERPVLQARADAAADVWLSGVDPEAQKSRHVTEPADYMDLFKPDAPWKKAASGLAVFKFGTRFVLHADDAELRTVIDDLKDRHIAFAVELGVLESGGPGTCGYGVEGYGNPTAVESVAKRVKALGGQIDYVAMDEPVWFGHIVDKVSKSSGTGCRYSVPEIAEKAAAKIAVLRRYFPDIKIGDIEPVSARAPGGPQSIEDILTFEICCARKPAPPLSSSTLTWPGPSKAGSRCWRPSPRGSAPAACASASSATATPPPAETKPGSIRRYSGVGA